MMLEESFGNASEIMTRFDYSTRRLTRREMPGLFFIEGV
jgi:hypothetical protein